MRKLISSHTYVTQKRETASRGTHFINATNEVYLENKTTLADDAAYALYDKINAVSGEATDDWECKSLIRRLFMAENGINVTSSLESLSCYGETVKVITIEDYHWKESYIHQMRTELAGKRMKNKLNAKLDNDIISDIKTKAKVRVFREKLESVTRSWPGTCSSNVPKQPVPGKTEVCLPLVKRVFPSLLAEHIDCSRVPSAGVAYANRFMRRHKKRKK